MNEENDEEECESVNDRSVNINKVPHVTKTGPDRFLEKNLKKIICKVPQRHKTRIDPDSLLRKGLKKIVYGRLGHETAGVRRREQGLKQKQSEMSDPEQCPETDTGVVGSWNSETCDPIPAGLNLGEDGQGDLVVETIEQPGEEEFVIESIDEQPNEFNSKPITKPPDNLGHTMWGQEGEIDFTDVTLASEDGTRTKAHRLSSAGKGANPPEGERLESGGPERLISGPPPAPSAPGTNSSERNGPEGESNPLLHPFHPTSCCLNTQSLFVRHHPGQSPSYP